MYSSNIKIQKQSYNFTRSRGINPAQKLIQIKALKNLDNQVQTAEDELTLSQTTTE